MSEANKAIISHFAEALWQKRDVDVIDEVFHEDAIIHSPFNIMQGRPSMRDIAEKWLSAFPDLEINCHDMIAEGDKVVCRWTAHGTHMGGFFDTSPTHQEVTYAGVTTFELKDGKVAEYWALIDMHAILTQLEDYDHVSEALE